MPEIKLFNSDCLEVLKTIPDESIDLILQDPPYNTTACKWEWDIMTKIDEFWDEWKRIIKDHGAIIITATQPFTSLLICSNIKNYKATWYWKKERGTNFVQAKRYPMRVIEDCIVFCKTTPKYNPNMREVKPYSHVLPKAKNGESQHMDSKSVDDKGNRIYKKYDKAYPINLLEIPRDNMSRGKSLHPTQKPVALMEYLIKTYTDEDDIVFDGFMGSGTTVVAAKKLNRSAIGVELDFNYFQKAKQRIDNA